MSKTFIKKICITTLLIIALGLSFTVSASIYIPTSRDTKTAPKEYIRINTDDTADGYTFLTKQGNLNFFFRDDRDVVLIEDTISGEIFKTGLDVPFKKEAQEKVKKAATPEEKLLLAEPYEDNLNSMYTAFANSLLSVEYYNASQTIEIISSASEKDVKSELKMISDGNYVLEVGFTNPAINVLVNIYCTDKGIRYRVNSGDINGEGVKNIAALVFTPFFGASGGAEYRYNPDTDSFDDYHIKEMIPGYAFVPDGSGALIRFQDNTVALRRYTGQVYGRNPAENMYYYEDYSDAVEFKRPVMPVFGIAHGNNQKGFVAWANSGAEHLEINMSPEENMTYYNYCYPRFVYNTVFHQVYNRAGEGYYKTFEERLDFDSDITYTILTGEDANYIGMAKEYRNHLISEGELDPRASGEVPEDMPIRIDFVMSDVKKGVIGLSDVVATTAKDAENIINDLKSKWCL